MRRHAKRIAAALVAALLVGGLASAWSTADRMAVRYMTGTRRSPGVDWWGAEVRMDGPAPGMVFFGWTRPSEDPPGLRLARVSGEVQEWSWKHRRKRTRVGVTGAPVALLAVEGDRLLALGTDDGMRAWSTANHSEVSVPGIRLLPPATEAPFLGSTEPWVLKDPLWRLIDAENRFGLMLDGIEVVAVPAAAYQPHLPRIEPWSRW